MKAPLALTLLLPALLAGQQAPLILRHATVIDGTGTPPLADRAILITGDRIVAVIPDRELAADGGATRQIDLGGRTVIPGLWDAHAHSLLDDPTAEAFAPTLLANGVVGVRDMGGFLPTLLRWRERLRADPWAGPRVVAAGPLIDGRDPVDPRISLAVADSAQARYAVALLADRGVDFLKVYTNLSFDAWRAVIEEGRARGLPVAGHIPKGSSALEAARLGQASIEHGQGIDLQCRSRSPSCDATVTALLAAGTRIVPTLIVQQQGGKIDQSSVTSDHRLGYVPRSLRAEWRAYASIRSKGGRARELRRVRAEFEQEVALVATLWRAGIPLLAGSDAGALYTYPGFSLHEEIALLVRAGVPPVQAIRSASGAVTEFLGLADSLGTIAPGQVADLVILDADPLRDIRNTRRIRTVIYRGRVLDREGLDLLLARGRDLAGR